MGMRSGTSSMQTWPAEGLEHVEQCPVCGSADRTLLYEGLTDRVFFCAHGVWTLQRCRECRSAYLDPRPTRETIGLAYSRYYTHAAGDRGSVHGLSWMGRLRRAVGNGYLNGRYGTDFRPASLLGRLAVTMVPGKRVQLDAQARNLPSAWPGAALLDVGCGNGDFLDFARRAGWQVTGVDPDPKAAETAWSRGLDVRLGGIEVLDGSGAIFDVVTLSHVIEHAHEPLQMLRACQRLLRRGGFLWLETPNLDSIGHRVYGPNWRGLEPPRHFVLFTWGSLVRALEAAGFARIEPQPARPLCSSIFAASEAIARGRDPYTEARLSPIGRWRAFLANRRAERQPKGREFITVKAWKQP